ncbi:hypothetical protein D7V97_27255 [Corallococcus sp. CA053C]|uniref:hypothetical protein n=1 Tax=Corallococcus sp. CA053C TaxID=2316732 RepID=UPI000EA0B8CA|nr:hypothetical protein [Corallococcus sp. CA053C]RKH02933.1 hypothetical protein D7V97_27255 [Corallococcus sp. CA053C]
MSMEDFAECYALRVGSTVDQVIADLNKIGSDGISQFLAWWRGLSDADRALVTLVISFSSSVVLKIFTKAVGEVVGLGLLGLAGGASWALIVRGIVDCESRL